MKIRMLLQVGAFHGDEDFFRLGGHSAEILDWVVNQDINLVVKKIYHLADNTPHLIEYEGEAYVPPHLPSK